MITPEAKPLQIQCSILRSGLTVTERTYIGKQSELFEQQRSQLIKDYPDQWVLFADNQILDADSDYRALLERVRQAQNDRLVIIKKVEPLIIRASDAI